MFKFGIIGAGAIAEVFTKAFDVIENSCVKGVATTSYDKAKKFCHKMSLEKPYESSEELIKDIDVDAVYIATLNDSHYDYIIKCLSNNKHVYCEKPMTLNYEQSKKCFDLANEKGLLLIEGMWTSFLPAIKEVKAIVDSGKIGEVSYLQADFGFQKEFDENHRLYKKEGGGALYDVGVYVISVANLFLGTPTAIYPVATLAKNGVDSNVTMVFSYDNKKANLFCAVDTNTKHELVIYGTKGKIQLDKFWCAQSYTIEIYDESIKTVEKPFVGNGFNYIIEAFIKGVNNRKLELEEHPSSKALLTAKIFDFVNKNINLKNNFSL